MKRNLGSNPAKLFMTDNPFDDGRWFGDHDESWFAGSIETLLADGYSAGQIAGAIMLDIAAHKLEALFTKQELEDYLAKYINKEFRNE